MISIVEEKYITTDGNSSRYVEIRCESTDTKPTEGIAPNSLALELDTNTLYYFNGSSWVSNGSGGGGGGSTGDSMFVRVDLSQNDFDDDGETAKQPKSEEVSAVLEADKIPVFVMQMGEEKIVMYPSSIAYDPNSFTGWQIAVSMNGGIITFKSYDYEPEDIET